MQYCIQYTGAAVKREIVIIRILSSKIQKKITQVLTIIIQKLN